MLHPRVEVLRATWDEHAHSTQTPPTMTECTSEFNEIEKKLS